MEVEVKIISACEKELKKFPKEILEDFLDAIARLKIGFNLTMPLSRPMPSIGPSVRQLPAPKGAGLSKQASC